VIENATETEGRDAMTCAAIDECSRVTNGLPGRVNAMAGIASVTHNLRAGVVGEGTLKTVSRMAGTAFGAGVRVGRGRRLTYGDQTVVATLA
jgi:hypothetical protein